jgi:autotransporter-associated beta strand protein
MRKSIPAQQRRALKLMFSVLSAGMALPLQSLHAADGTWTATSGGSWGDAANWSGGTIANASTDIAVFAAGSAAQVITLDTTRSLKAIQFGSGANGPITFNVGTSGSFRLNPSSSGAVTLFVDANSGDHTVNSTIQLQSQENQTWQINGDRTLLVNGTLSAIGTIRGLTKSGTGTLVLAGTSAATFNGNLVINSGTLVFDYTTNNTTKINPSGSLTLGGGTLSLRGNSTGPTAQSVSRFTLNPGASMIRVATGSGQNATLAIGAIDARPSPGGVLDISLVGNGGGIAAVTTSNFNESNGLVGSGFITVGQNDWATVSSNNIVAYSGYTVSTNPTAWTGGQNISIGSGFSGTVATGSISTLKFAVAQPSAVSIGSTATLTLRGGGILVSTAVGANDLSISGGSLTSGNGYDLIVHQHNTAGTLNIGANIVGAVALTKAGRGVLNLLGSNSYSGGTTINTGVIRVENAQALGTGSVSVNRATLELGGVTVSTPALNLNDGATLRGTGNAAYSKGGYPSIAAAAGVTLSAPSASDTLSINTAVQSAGSGGGSITVSGLGRVALLSGSVSGYSGLWSVAMGSGGVLQLNNNNSLGVAASSITVVSGTVAAGTNISIANAMVLAGGSLSAVNGNATFGGSTSLAPATASTLSLVDAYNGVTARNLSLTGPIGGSGHLNVAGAGIATLTADNGYSGNTTITGGRLTLAPVNVSSSNNIPASAKISIGSAGTLDVLAIPAAGGFKLGTTQTLAGTGNVDGDVTADSSTATVMPGDTDSPGNLTLRNNFTLTSGKLAIESDSSSFSVLTVSGAVMLGGTLQLKAAHQPALSAPITIVNKTSSGAISGIFAGLAENAYFHPDSGFTSDWYKISYFGGNGNDIVISRQSVPEPGSLALLALATSSLLRRRRRA